MVSTSARSYVDTILHITSLSKKNKFLYNVAKDIRKLDDFCITEEEKDQRIKELKQLNKSIAYSSSTLFFFWQHESMLSYKRDQVYDLLDMIGTNNEFQKEKILLENCNLICNMILSLLVANFGGMYGCAIGMSLMAAIEIFYWIFVKPFLKFLSENTDYPSPTYRRFSRFLRIIAFLSCAVYAWYRFFLVVQMIKNPPKPNEKRNLIN